MINDSDKLEVKNRLHPQTQPRDDTGMMTEWFHPVNTPQLYFSCEWIAAGLQRLFFFPYQVLFNCARVEITLNNLTDVYECLQITFSPAHFCKCSFCWTDMFRFQIRYQLMASKSLFNYITSNTTINLWLHRPKLICYGHIWGWVMEKTVWRLSLIFWCCLHIFFAVKSAYIFATS